MSWSSQSFPDDFSSECSSSGDSCNESVVSLYHYRHSLPDRMNPSSIRFCQDSILNEFRDGTLLEDVVDDLLSRSIDVEDIRLIRPIRVFLWDGTDSDFRLHADIEYDYDTYTYTCDNRRLFVFQQFEDRSYGEVTIPVEWIDLEDVDEDKLTTECDGETIRVRGVAPQLWFCVGIKLSRGPVLVGATKIFLHQLQPTQRLLRHTSRHPQLKFW